MAFPEFLQQNTMKMFALTYAEFTDEYTMMRALSEFQTTMGPNVEDWEFRMKEYLIQAGSSEEALEVFDRFVDRYVKRKLMN